MRAVPEPTEQIARLERRLARERKTRRQAEEIAERTTSVLYDRQRELELLEAVAAASNEATTLEEALKVVIERICAHTRWPLGHAFLVDPSNDRLVSSGIWHMEDPAAFERFRQVTEAATFVAGEGLPGRVLERGEPAWIVDTTRDANFPRQQAAPDAGIHGAFAFPIRLGDEVVAVVEIFNDSPTPLDAGLLAVSAQIGVQLGRVVERARAREKIAHQGLHDSLTGLPNRMLFIDRLRTALRRSSRGMALTGVLFIDLDRFKTINDSLGHEAGDEVLVEVARRFDMALRPGDTVARLGGDEFVVLCEDLDREDDALRVAERLQARLLTPFKLRDGEEHLVTASIGVALTRDSDGEAEALLRDADAAMYRAKDLGRARHELFDDGMRARVTERWRTERALGHALDHAELRLHYQPIVALADRGVAGVEALVRWEDPARGLVPRGEFIPFAEESGLISPIGEWVLVEACRQAARWRREFAGEAPLPVSVNLAARQLAQEDLPAVVTGALRAAGLEPSDLALEITESALIERAEVAASTIAELRALGVQVHVDDFGTGYSSLGFLQRFRVDALKIDRSFVADLGERSEASAIVGAIVAMGHALGLTVVAEGIETERQAAEALALGCDFGQGYLFARPVPAIEMVAAASNGDRRVIDATALS